MHLVLDPPVPRSALARRLLPLHVAAFLQGFMLWPPVEKLFMTEIGFDEAAVGVMAACYAAVVPLVEIPSGVLADRWSRRGVLVGAGLALTFCALTGAISDSVPAYVVSALFLGVYFAMYSGTMDALVYDTVLEVTAAGDGFERQLGRIRLTEATALVAGSLLGGLIADSTSSRTTYFLTVPVAALSILALLRFQEPRLHEAGHRDPLRRHLMLTFRSLSRSAGLLPVVTLAVLSSLVLQLLIEFGPLWLVALAVPASLYGPYWAGLMSSFGLAGLLAGRVHLDRWTTAAPVAGLMISAGTALTSSTSGIVVAGAQILLGSMAAMAGIHVTRLLHDGVPSTVRSGVASGVGAVSWMVFLPLALVFGVVSTRLGVHATGWVLAALSAAAGGLLVVQSLRRPPGTPTRRRSPAI